MFAARLRQRLKGWIVLWGAIMGICFLAGVVKMLSDTPAAAIRNDQLDASISDDSLILWMLIAASCFLLAEYVRSSAFLLLSAIGLSLAILALEGIITTGLMKLGLPRKIFEYSYEAKRGAFYGISFSIYYMAILHTAYAWWALRRAKAQGDAWFRFPNVMIDLRGLPLH